MALKIWIDADACPKPIREIVYRASNRLRIPVVLVANSYVAPPRESLVTAIQVPKGTDVADSYIVEHLAPGDIVVTSDVPLASFVVDKGGLALDHRGEEYDEENVKERLSIRDFMKEIRDGGVITGGPAPFGPKDVEYFANALNRVLTKHAHRRGPC